MTRRERVRYEALLRVRDFGKAHPELFTESLYGQQALATVGRAIEQYETRTTDRLIAAGEIRNQRARRKVILDRMHTIARTSRRVDLPSGEKMRLQIPHRASHVAVAAAAREFLRHAEAQPGEFVKFGLPPTCLTDLRQTLEIFEGAMSDRRLGRAAVARARIDMHEAIAMGALAVLDLDVVVRNVAADDPGMLAAWERDMRIVEGTGKRKPKKSEATAAPATHGTEASSSAPPGATPEAASTPMPDTPAETLRKVS